MPQTILWYDLETFGRIPGWDRVAQFAAIRTDASFEPVEEPITLYCRISSDYIPDPDACRITGITPQVTLDKGIPEKDFFTEINRIFSVPGTCVAGFNNIRFDDEFIRYGFYRNFLDPYQREWKNGNSRWDVIDLFRATHDLRPEGIIWPEDSEGRPVFRLEVLTEANKIEHAHSHDALSDVYATIGMARLVHEKQPRLFSWVFNNRGKDRLKTLINLQTMEPLVHTSVMFTRKEGCTTLVAPLTMDPVNRNCVLTFDLREDPTPLLELDEKEIRHRIFSTADDLGPDLRRIPIKGVHLNKCPVLAPSGTLDEDSARRLGLDKEKILSHHAVLAKHPEAALKVRKIFEQAYSSGSRSDDVDFQLYTGGFFNDSDLQVFEKIRLLTPQEIINWQPDTYDPRFGEMYRRYKGRNYPELLDDQEKTRWKTFSAGRILMPPHPDATDWGTFRKKLEGMRSSPDLSVKGKLVLKDLSEYAEKLNRELFQ